MTSSALVRFTLLVLLSAPTWAAEAQLLQVHSVGTSLPALGEVLASTMQSVPAAADGKLHLSDTVSLRSNSRWLLQVLLVPVNAEPSSSPAAAAPTVRILLSTGEYAVIGAAWRTIASGEATTRASQPVSYRVERGGGGFGVRYRVVPL